MEFARGLKKNKKKKTKNKIIFFICLRWMPFNCVISGKIKRNKRKINFRLN